MLKRRVLVELSTVLHIPESDITLIIPKHGGFGDYSVNLQALRGAEKSPDDIRTSLEKSDLFEKVEVVGTFLNMFIARSVLVQIMHEVVSHPDDFGKIQEQHPKRIMLEYGQPNTHKLPHIAHLFSYIYGESMSRIFSWNGQTVYRANYQGDVGLHVAKCLFCVQQKLEKLPSLKTLDQKIQFLQECYQEGSAIYDSSESAKTAITDLNRKIYERHEDIHELWETTRQWSLDMYEEFEALLGINIDRHYFESETWQTGRDIVASHVGSVFEESDGAIIFKGEDYGLHTRVFVTSQGIPTYEAKDIGLIKVKTEEWPYDVSIVATAKEQNSYAQVVIKAGELIFPDLAGKLKHIGFGMIDLKSGKMSSRTGNIVSGIDLISTIENLVIDTLLEGEAHQSETAQVLALGAIKYAFLKSDAHKNMSFDIHESISLQGNSGPYVLYAYARMKSILRKASMPEVVSHKAQLTLNTVPSTDDLQETEIRLLKLLPRFSGVLQDAMAQQSAHGLCTYIFDLTQAFNAFYETTSVLQADTEAQKDFRLALTEATSIVIKNSLFVLGIQTIEKI